MGADKEPALAGADEELALAGALGWSQRQPTGFRLETLQTPDDRLLPVEVASVGEFHRLVVRDPDPEKCKEDLSVEGAGEGERHEYPRIGEWVVARLSHGDESHVFIHFGGRLFTHTPHGKRR